MITEDYVSFETAKLLKEKGFDEECSCFYDNIVDYVTPGLEVDGQLYYKNSFLDDEEYAAPTLQMAMKWLREKHNISIEPLVDFGSGNECWWSVDVAYIKKNGLIDELCGYNSYEEACEAAIKYYLENLI